MTSSTETVGHPSRSASHRWKIQPKEFRAIFDPSAFPKLTYLLYEIKWGSSTKFWRKWCPNTPTQHAEINCLENDFKAIHHRPSVRCSIIWFLSWSPCGLCCRLIIHFLRAHPKVSLQIYIGRLFRLRDERNRQGLRDLVSSGVNIYIMSLPEGGEALGENYPPHKATWSQIDPQPSQLMTTVGEHLSTTKSEKMIFTGPATSLHG
ncbi:C-_U-editing enzyme APOBEC-1-like isoform X5 [Malaclemys terrapin pileata]|uniref:C->U-editing enzyme APOBEC-1-like isoform X5 n=1 Tax=Malaclemys terrapin pileata TaxID=2991368 RepID=UPI0023A8367E|nr:C->U-editing enzyme APOBEC-1-like isoform X5 [Malaclemys terrapin pileata]XP_053896107.1 C->U-editing enzyme APOBEC-1-like isoform X5 [Malaclemys terrapin pileata]XP_053896116.1 C->U-editing enzyme APOBEC-1-like isoform X5 [Malaclemys terrapin pileata]